MYGNAYVICPDIVHALCSLTDRVPVDILQLSIGVGLARLVPMQDVVVALSRRFKFVEASLVSYTKTWSVNSIGHISITLHKRVSNPDKYSMPEILLFSKTSVSLTLVLPCLSSSRIVSQ
jgi:hypothetical protein